MFLNQKFLRIHSIFPPRDTILKIGGYTNINQVYELDWSSLRVSMVIGSSEFPGVENAVTALYLSNSPAMTTTFNGHVEFNIHLNQFFGLVPTDFPTKMSICTLPQYGGECASSVSFLKRNPAHTAADTIGFPSPLLAACSNLPGGRTDLEPGGAWAGYTSGHYALSASEIYFDKPTVITGFTAVITNAATTGAPTTQHGFPTLSIYSSLNSFATSPLQADILDRAPMNFVGNGTPIGNNCVGIFNNFQTIHSEVRLQNPITLQPGFYVFSPRYEESGLYFTQSLVDLGSDYATGYTNPGLLYNYSQVYIGTSGTNAFNMLGY